MATIPNKRRTVTPDQLSIQEGDPVEVTLDDGRVLLTRALGQPWQLGHGAWVVKVEGTSGGYALERVEKV